jgi:hypothetical protein
MSRGNEPNISPRANSNAVLISSGVALLCVGGMVSVVFLGLVALGTSDSNQGWRPEAVFSALFVPILTGIGLLVHVVGGVICARTAARAWLFALSGWMVPVVVFFIVTFLAGRRHWHRRPVRACG